MAALKPGSVSGYQSAGRELRADAGKPGSRSAGGSHKVADPYSPPSPLMSPGKPASIRAGIRTLSRNIQQAQFALRLLPPSAAAGPGTAGTPGTAGSQQWRYTATTAQPANSGTAYNSGGGNPAHPMSGSPPAYSPGLGGGPPKGLPAPSSPGQRVTSKPPTSMRQSQAGRRRQAANFKASHTGPKIIQGTAETVTPAQPFGGKQGNRGWKIQAGGNRNRGKGGREGPSPAGTSLSPDE